MKLGVFVVVDEKESYDNGCKPLMLKWVDVVQDWCVERSRRPKTEMNNLDQSAAVGRVENACVNNDDRTQRWKPC